MILSHLIVADINLSQVNDAEIISFEMIICRVENHPLKTATDLTKRIFWQKTNFKISVYFSCLARIFISALFSWSV
jgi:hypothetical protein